MQMARGVSHSHWASVGFSSPMPTQAASLASFLQYPFPLFLSQMKKNIRSVCSVCFSSNLGLLMKILQIVLSYQSGFWGVQVKLGFYSTPAPSKFFHASQFLSVLYYMLLSSFGYCLSFFFLFGFRDFSLFNQVWEKDAF